MIYCDLDGVLADFEKGVKDLTGKHPWEQSPKSMWGALAHAKDFYYTLDWMPEGEYFWNEIKHLNPTILTGLPWGGWAAGQKKRWCGEKLGWDVQVVTCMTTEKPNYCSPGDILIDDMTRIQQKWIDAGGIFIHYTEAEQALVELEEFIDG